MCRYAQNSYSILKGFDFSRYPLGGKLCAQRVESIICLISEHTIIIGPCKAHFLVYFYFFSNIPDAHSWALPYEGTHQELNMDTCIGMKPPK